MTPKTKKVLARKSERLSELASVRRSSSSVLIPSDTTLDPLLLFHVRFGDSRQLVRVIPIAEQK